MCIRDSDELVLLDRVHAAELRAQRVADCLVTRSGAGDVADPLRHLPVTGPQHGVERSGRGEQTVHLHAGDHVRELSEAVLRLEAVSYTHLTLPTILRV